MFSPEAIKHPEIKKIALDYLAGKGIAIQTSGSTGDPKLYQFSHEQLKASALRTISFFGLNKNTKALLCLSHKTIGGAMMVIRAIEANYRLDCITPSSNPFANLNETYDFVALAPIQLTTSLESNLDTVKKVRHLLIGGGPISRTTELLLEKEKISAWHSYGMTETCSHVALRKAGYDANDYFEALPNIEFLEQFGKLGIVLPDQTLWTNDLVTLHSKEKFSWHGRADFTINTGGVKVQIEELEGKLKNFIPCEFCIWKEDDETFGERIVILCEKEFQSDKEILLKNIDKFQIPKRFYLVQEIIKSELGKPLRQKTYDQKIRSFEALL